MGGEWKDNPEAASKASMTHGIYSIRDNGSYAEKLALFKSDSGREDIRAELGVVVWEMFQAWKAHLRELAEDGPEAVLTAPVNKNMAVYLNLLFRIVDTWPKSTDGYFKAELQRIKEVVEAHAPKE